MYLCEDLFVLYRHAVHKRCALRELSVLKATLLQLVYDGEVLAN